MQLKNEKINRDKYYSVGYSPELDKYVLACTVTWVAWYNRYYEISEEEYKKMMEEQEQALGELDLDVIKDETEQISA